MYSNKIGELTSTLVYHKDTGVKFGSVYGKTKLILPIVKAIPSFIIPFD
jgi:hypothetical protein